MPKLDSKSIKFLVSVMPLSALCETMHSLLESVMYKDEEVAKLSEETDTLRAELRATLAVLQDNRNVSCEMSTRICNLMDERDSLIGQLRKAQDASVEYAEKKDKEIAELKGELESIRLVEKENEDAR